MNQAFRTAKRKLHHAGSFLLRGAMSLVYPPHCLACGTPLSGQERLLLCARCLSSVRPVENGCPRCGTPLGPHGPEEGRCTSCRKRRLHFDLAVGAFLYEGTVKRLLHRLKFEGVAVASRALASLAFSAAASPALAVDVVVPVPMHWLRRVRRGYNQSERIASFIAGDLKKPLVRALRRVEAREPQVELSREERLGNPSGSFAPGRTGPVKGKKVLLVDDVMTTAATVSECARVLKGMGATEVIAFSIARQA